MYNIIIVVGAGALGREGGLLLEKLLCSSYGAAGWWTAMCPILVPTSHDLRFLIIEYLVGARML